MIDLHCHILPGLDDGPDGFEKSLEMAKIARTDGIQIVCATPHTLNSIYLNPTETIRARVIQFRKYLLEHAVNLRLCMGAEAHLSPQLMPALNKGTVATLNGSGKFILLEFPALSIPPGTQNIIFELKMKGITPIIVHPERNIVFQHDMKMLYELLQAGALSQITAMSITGAFGDVAQQCAHAFLKQRWVHVIASDAHSADQRPPILSEAVEAAADILENYDEARRMVRDIPLAILKGLPPTIDEPRSFL